jgi:hypothetical protein
MRTTRPTYDRRVGLKFLLVESDAPIRSARLIGYICALVSRGVPVTLAVQGPSGRWPVKIFVNHALASAIIRHDATEAARVMVLLVRDLRAGAFEPAVF